MYDVTLIRLLNSKIHMDPDCLRWWRKLKKKKDKSRIEKGRNKT